MSHYLKSRYIPFHLLRRQLCVFSCSAIHHSKYRLCLICVFVRCATEQPSFSQQNSSLFLLSSPHPLFILSSHLISSPLILLFSQEAPGSTSMGLKRNEGDRERHEGRREMRTEREGQGEWKRRKKTKQKVTKKEEEDGGKQKKRNRNSGKDRETARGRVSNYRTPSVFKAPLLSHPSCGWEKEKQRKEGEEERKTKVQALVQLRQQAPVIHITHTSRRHTQTNL